VDQPPHAVAPACVDHVARSLDVDALDYLRRPVVGVARGDVHDDLAAVDDAPERRRVEQIHALVAHLGALLT
jgi:hypothetical protein